MSLSLQIGTELLYPGVPCPLLLAMPMTLLVLGSLLGTLLPTGPQPPHQKFNFFNNEGQEGWYSHFMDCCVSHFHLCLPLWALWALPSPDIIFFQKMMLYYFLQVRGRRKRPNLPPPWANITQDRFKTWKCLEKGWGKDSEVGKNLKLGSDKEVYIWLVFCLQLSHFAWTSLTSLGMVHQYDCLKNLIIPKNVGWESHFLLIETIFKKLSLQWNCLHLKAQVPWMTFIWFSCSTTFMEPIPTKVMYSFSATFQYSSANSTFVAWSKFGLSSLLASDLAFEKRGGQQSQRFQWTNHYVCICWQQRWWIWRKDLQVGL